MSTGAIKNALDLLSESLPGISDQCERLGNRFDLLPYLRVVLLFVCQDFLRAWDTLLNTRIEVDRF
jgi:hypothetical protein